VFAKLEEELITPNGSDKGFLTKLLGRTGGTVAPPKKKKGEDKGGAAGDGKAHAEAPAQAEKKRAILAPDVKETRCVRASENRRMRGCPKS
jgi:hypothetical protein